MIVLRHEKRGSSWNFLTIAHVLVILSIAKHFLDEEGRVLSLDYDKEKSENILSLPDEKINRKKAKHVCIPIMDEA